MESVASSGISRRFASRRTLFAMVAAVAFACASNVARGADDWLPFAPAADSPDGCEFDLRRLNEPQAGDGGFIVARDGRFLHGKTGRPVRFWGVNGPPHDLHGDDLRRAARMLARYGVNLVRVHGGLFDARGEVDPAKVRHAREVAAALKAEGIYTLFSIYFPLWFKPPADLEWLPGYDGQRHPFAALQFNRRFQEKHREWFRALLTTPDANGRKLIDDPAVFGVEIQNEDSFFFWTFDAKNIPDAQLKILETRFGEWLVKRYGSPGEVAKAWKNLATPRDDFATGRVGFRPLWNLAHEKTQRDQDTAEFLWEVQTEFYRESIAFLRDLGFRGMIQASNWATASPEVLGPLEKLSYVVGDYVDRHGYFECGHRGENAAWSIRNGHVYRDRSALRFDPLERGKPKSFVHPAMDPQYDDKPSMISETTFTRPNRYRSEAPLYYAAYGALQDSDAIVHFAFDGARWQVKPNFWMQQWTLASPAMMGQFPAAALVYRQGLVEPGEVLADVRLNRSDLLKLSGTPLPQDAAFDELRMQDVPRGGDVASAAGRRLDPLLHYAGRAVVRFSNEPGRVETRDLGPWIDRRERTVTSTHRQVWLDYDRGVLVLDSPRVQAASGDLHAAGVVEFDRFSVESELDLLHVVLVPLDDRPLDESRRMLLQVMTEERATGFATEPVDDDVRRIIDLGRDPWTWKRPRAAVTFKGPEARGWKIAALDVDGRRLAPSAESRRRSEEFAATGRLDLSADAAYYLIER